MIHNQVTRAKHLSLSAAYLLESSIPKQRFCQQYLERELPLSLTHIFTFHYAASFPYSHCYKTHTYCWIVSKTELMFPYLKREIFPKLTNLLALYSISLCFQFQCSHLATVAPLLWVQRELKTKQIFSTSPLSFHFCQPSLTAPPSWKQSNNVLLIDQRGDWCSVEVNGCHREW